MLAGVSIDYYTRLELRQGAIHHDQTDGSLDKLSSSTNHLRGESSTNPTTLET